MSTGRIARSFLFVPGNRPERFAKALASGAHGVIIDLEDAVAVTDKAVAREALRRFLDSGGQALVRINALDTAWARDDLALCGQPGVTGVVLPKADSAAGIAEVARHLGDATPVLPLIESARGLAQVREVANAPRVQRLLFGTVDFGLDLGIDGDGDELAFHRALLVLESRAAGLLPPVDGVTLTLKDESALTAATHNARRIGFGGKLCVHPSQVAPVNACFQPTASQLEWARKVVALAETSAGAFELDGKMVDAPVIARARLMLV